MIRSTLFLPHRIDDKELVAGVGGGSGSHFSCQLVVKLQFLIVLFVRVIQLELGNIACKFT